LLSISTLPAFSAFTRSQKTFSQFAYHWRSGTISSSIPIHTPISISTGVSIVILSFVIANPAPEFSGVLGTRKNGQRPEFG
ncbi:hypothetical protein DM02DRAFT_678670, partial [Periconia macrospinosa]